MTINHGEHMHYYIKPKFFFDSLGDVQPSQPYSYTYGDRPAFEFSFLPNEIAEGDTLVFAVDNDMVFYDSAPENLLHSASCMVVVRHDVTAEEATAGKVQLRIETRTVKFRDVTNGKVRPVEVISGLYRRRGDGDGLNYVLMARGRAFANGIIADYDALPEPITTDEYYTRGDIDGLLSEKADAATLVAHTDNADIHVTLQDKTTWDSKADVTDIGNATVTITQGGVSKGSFSVNASENVTIEVNDGAQADWNETDTTSPAYIQNRPSIYTQSETNALLDAKADKATTYTKTETDGMLDAKANVATTLSGYGIQDAYTKTETDGLLNEKANVATTYTKDETNVLLDDKADKATTYTKTETDASLDAKADKASVYTKGETNSLLDAKADKTSTYTKDETDVLLNDKADKATTLAGYGIADAYTKTEVDAKVTSVYRYRGTVSTYADLPSSGQEVGDVWNIETADSAHGIKAGDNVAWNGTTWDALAGEIDLTAYPTKSELATVATTGDYNDLTNRPDLTTKLDAPAVAGTVGQVLTKTADGQVWADAPGGGGGETDGNPDYLSFYFIDDNKTITFSKNGNPTDVSLEYSFDKKTWTPVIVDSLISVPKQTKCYFRGNNNTFSTSKSDFYYFKFNGFPYIYGNIMSLLDKSCESKTVPNYCFANLFNITYTVNNIQSFQATLPATELGYGCYYRMFYNQNSNAAFDTVVLPAVYLKDECYKQMFYGCFSLKSVLFYGILTSRGSVDEMFTGCAYLSKLICYNSFPYSYYTYSWLNNTGTSISYPSLYCLNAEKITSRNESTVPVNWEVYSLNGTQGISNEVASSSETYTIKYGKTLDTPVITVASALTLSASTSVSTQIAYSEIVLDVATGATVTAGTNLTLVDAPTAGKRNICVVRWSNGVAKLYVTIVEDLPQA